MKKIIQLFMKMPQIIRYGLNSCIVTVLDLIIVWILFSGFHMNIVVANTLGVISGFLFDYILSVLFVFKQAKKTGGFTVYLVTFVFGLALADWLIYIGNTILFINMNEKLNFLFSKGLSIVVPFFLLYYLRKVIYILMENKHQMQQKGENKV